MDLEAEKVAIEARNSISEYCYSKCKAYCCRKGYLVLTEKEACAVADEEPTKLKENSIFTITSKGEYALNLGAKNKGCPRLKEFKCEIHNNQDMPKACKEFPIFLWENKKVRISERCSAAKEGLLYHYLAKFKMMEYSFAEKDDKK